MMRLQLLPVGLYACDWRGSLMMWLKLLGSIAMLLFVI
jgi:hypothetical protein